MIPNGSERSSAWSGRWAVYVAMLCVALLVLAVAGVFVYFVMPFSPKGEPLLVAEATTGDGL